MKKKTPAPKRPRPTGRVRLNASACRMPAKLVFECGSYIDVQVEVALVKDEHAPIYAPPEKRPRKPAGRTARSKPKRKPPQ